MQESPLAVEVAGVGWRLGLGGTPLCRYAALTPPPGGCIPQCGTIHIASLIG